MATTTAAERRARARAEFDAYMPVCPSREVFTRLSDKWVGLIVCGLAEGDMRYSELARLIAGVSQKMLTQTLRSLERDGLVTRTVTPSVPVQVSYGLTPLGASLVPIVQGVKAWAERNVTAVHQARQRFDAANR